MGKTRADNLSWIISHIHMETTRFYKIMAYVDELAYTKVILYQTFGTIFRLCDSASITRKCTSALYIPQLLHLPIILGSNMSCIREGFGGGFRTYAIVLQPGHTKEPYSTCRPSCDTSIPWRSSPNRWQRLNTHAIDDEYLILSTHPTPRLLLLSKPFSAWSSHEP
jgi:hypothetical protein